MAAQLRVINIDKSLKRQSTTGPMDCIRSERRGRGEPITHKLGRQKQLNLEKKSGIPGAPEKKKERNWFALLENARQETARH